MNKSPFSNSTVFRRSSLNPFSFRLQFGPSFKESFPYIFSENGRFSDLIELAKNTKKEDIKKWGYLFNADVFVENVIRPLYSAKTANVKKEDFDDNIFYCFDDFYLALRALKRKYAERIYQKEYANRQLEKTLKRFKNRIKAITPWEIKYREVDLNNVDKLLQFADWYRQRFREARRDGRPPESYNVIVYSLMNDLIYEKIRHKKRKAVIKRDLEFIIFILLWLHFHKQEFEEIQKFIDENKNNPILESINLLKKDLSKRYGNFRNSQRKERTPPFESEIIGLEKILFTDAGFKEIHL